TPAVFDGTGTQPSLPSVPLPVILKPPTVPPALSLHDALPILYPGPGVSMDRPEKVATPETTVTAAPPLRVPPAGLVPIARLTFVALSETTILPLASSTATLTPVVIVAPPAVLDGP